MSVIKKMFYGEINISEEPIPDRDQEIQKRLDESMEKFCNQLTVGQKDELDKLISLLLESSVDDLMYSFKRGFEIGFMLSEELNKARISNDAH